MMADVDIGSDFKCLVRTRSDRRPIPTATACRREKRLNRFFRISTFDLARFALSTRAHFEFEIKFQNYYWLLRGSAR